MSGQFHVPAALTPVPIGYEVGLAPESVSMLWAEKYLAPAGNRTPVVQAVAYLLYRLSLFS
jgi:hypothetical protein